VRASLALRLRQDGRRHRRQHRRRQRPAKSRWGRSWLGFEEPPESLERERPGRGVHVGWI
jgi:hypothetical protein